MTGPGRARHWRRRGVSRLVGLVVMFFGSIGCVESSPLTGLTRRAVARAAEIPERCIHHPFYKSHRSDRFKMGGL